MGGISAIAAILGRASAQAHGNPVVTNITMPGNQLLTLVTVCGTGNAAVVWLRWYGCGGMAPIGYGAFACHLAANGEHVNTTTSS